MLSIIRNDWNRMKEQKIYLAVAVGLTIFSVLMAVILTGKLQPKLNLAVVGLEGDLFANDAVRITELSAAPPKSSLVQKQYDAAILFEPDGSYQIQTVQGDGFCLELKKMIDGVGEPSFSHSNNRKIGANIIGYMLMFLLMQGMLYARMFAEDKEKHQIERIVCAPVPFRSYLAGHGVFVWCLIFAPAFLVIGAVKLSGMELGFSLFQYGILISVMGLMAVGTALCVNAFFLGTDTANMVGSCIIVLTSVLAGSFYDMSSPDSVLGKWMYLLPQKDFLYFVNAWEGHGLNYRSLLSLFYAIMVSAVLLVIGVVKTRRDYIYHRS